VNFAAIEVLSSNGYLLSVLFACMELINWCSGL